MSLNPGIYSSMGQTYTNQIGSINFTGYAYVYSTNTISVQPTTSDGKTNYISVTSNPGPIPITVGNHIVGPNIPLGTIITQDLGSGIYKVSKPQTQGGASVSAYVCIGTPVQYGQVVASAPTYGASTYGGKLDFYTPTQGKTGPTMTLINGNVGIGGKTAPLQVLDVSGSALISGNLAVGKTLAGQGLAMDVTGSVSVMNGNVGIGMSNPSNYIQILGSSSTSAAAPPDGGSYHNLNLISTKTGSTPYSMALGVDYTNGFGYINSAGNATYQPVCLQTRGGYVGIGTSSPASTLDITGTQFFDNGLGAKMVFYGRNASAANFGVGIQAGTLQIYSDQVSSSIQFGYGYSTSFTKSMRITGDQQFFGVNEQFIVNPNNSVNDYGIRINHLLGASGAWYIAFLYNNNTIGNINRNGTTGVLYTTGSDERLKIDLGLSTDVSVIDNIKIHNFKWKADNQQDIGVFAQEAYEIKPAAVSKGSDELNENGTLKQPWCVDYSKFVPDLIVYCQQLKKTVQEQQSTIQSLEQRLTALENK